MCLPSKKAGTQYTLTILPHFLLPGCLVRADDVFTTGMDKNIREDIDKACKTMGVLDDRTVKKHLARFDFCLNDSINKFAGTISEFGKKLPEIKPAPLTTTADINKNWFEKLAQIIVSIREELFGFEDISLQDIAWLSFFLFIRLTHVQL